MRLRFLLLLALSNACSDVPGAPSANGNVAGVTMQVLGSGTISTPPSMAEVAVVGTTAFTTTWSFNPSAPGNRVDVWDVSGSTPVRVTSVTISGTAVALGDVAVSDDGQIMIVPTERDPGLIVVFDISNPRAPVELSRFSSADTGPGVHTAKLGRLNGRLYAFLAVDPSGAFKARTVIVDLTTPTAPTQVHSRLANQSFVHDTYFRDGALFIAQWDDGVVVLDVGGLAHGGTISAPVEVSRLVTVGGEVHSVWWYKDATGAKRYAFVGQEGPSIGFSSASGDVHVVDLVNPAAPKEVAFYNGGTHEGASVGAHNLWMDESKGILYVSYYNGGVRALDVTGDLSACASAERAPDGRCDLGRMGRERGRGLQDTESVYVWGVRYDGGFVYASDMFGRLWKLKAL